MIKIYGVVFLLSISSLQMFSQTSSIQDILHTIENNNKELQSYQNFLASKHKANKSKLSLSDPEFSVYYLPWGNTQEGAYNEFQLTQQFEFPTVYTHQNKLNVEQQKRGQFLFDIKRQNILFKAKKICLNLIYTLKRITLETERLTQTQQLFIALILLLKPKMLVLLITINLN